MQTLRLLCAPAQPAQAEGVHARLCPYRRPAGDLRRTSSKQGALRTPSWKVIGVLHRHNRLVEEGLHGCALNTSGVGNFDDPEAVAQRAAYPAATSEANLHKTLHAQVETSCLRGSNSQAGRAKSQAQKATGGEIGGALLARTWPADRLTQTFRALRAADSTGFVGCTRNSIDRLNLTLWRSDLCSIDTLLPVRGDESACVGPQIHSSI